MGIENESAGNTSSNIDKHFSMSADYEKNSSSQKTIGQLLIESTENFSRINFQEPKELNVVDLACGPGNLTIELKQALQSSFPHTKINLTGLDYSKESIAILARNSKKSKNDISGLVGSFYDLPVAPESVDIITSNEGLHWQDPYVMSEIIYSQLPPAEKSEYEAWALANFKKAIKNIFNSLKKDGIAVLQFGHEGQLQKLWDLVGDTLSEEQFRRYKNDVNFPLYYPSMENIRKALSEAGFQKENIEVGAFDQDLTEDTPKSIRGFFEAFSRPGFSKSFDSTDLDAFYNRIEERLSQTDIDKFRKNQWNRTLIKLKK